MRFLLLPLSVAALATPSFAQLWESCNLARTITGENAGDNFGWVSRNAGDVDGDGFADVVTGAQTFGPNGEGRAYVHSSATGALLWSVTGAPGGALGFGVAGVGDVNGDGRSDVVIGAPAGVGIAGEAWVLDGTDGSRIRTLSAGLPSDQFGASVDRAGDVDGDSVVDIAVGAPGDDQVAQNAGRIYVYSGATGALLLEVAGEAQGDNFGSCVGTVGDRNGDGFDDIVACAMNGGTAGRGRAYVIDGAGVLPTVTLEPGTTGVGFGQFFCGACGDVDADGLEDFFVSDWQDATLGAQTGRAYVYSGATLATLHEIVGENAGDAYAIGRGYAGDVDHDGHDDLFFASYVDNNGVQNAGTGRIHSGATGELLGEFHGDVGGDALGFDADGLGDIDGDGEPDFLLSSVTGSAMGGTGLVHLISGAPAPPRKGCDSNAHTGGATAQLTYRRSISLASASMRLRVFDAIPNATVIPFYGFTGNQAPLGGGVLCVGGPLHRLPVGTLNATGALLFDLDFASAPLGAGPGAVAAGVPVHFQAWFRDVNAVGGASTSASLVMTFCP